MAKMDIKEKKCLTPTFRVSFPHLFEKHQFEKNEPKFSLVMLFSRTTDLKELKRAAFNAAVEKWGTDKTKWPKFKHPAFKDGDDKPDLAGYPGCIYVSASSKNRPGVVDLNMSPITAEDEAIYPGCYARATLIAFAYDQAGNKGVSFSLQNVQKLKDGEPLGAGKRNPEEDFGGVAPDALGADDTTNVDDMEF